MTPRQPSVPKRFRNWIFFWTPVSWLVLEMISYPKDRPIATGIKHVLGGFIAPTVANYPAAMTGAIAVGLTLVGAVGAIRNAKQRRFYVALLIMAVLLWVWTLITGDMSHFSLAGQHATVSWLFQTIAILLAAVAAWLWAAGAPERAELTVWNTRQVWKLYRGNWQGMAGLYILFFFAALALFAPFLADHAKLDPNSYVGKPFSPPAAGYYMLFGTDRMGQSVLAEFIWSARISLVVGLLATAISTILGAGIGIVAGFYSGWVGEVLMRITDMFLVIPWLPLAMVIASIWGKNFWWIIVIIGFTSWPGTARVVRSDVLRVRELQFVERARAIGSSNSHIMNKHVMPNVFPLIFANTILVVAIAILSETTLSFLGLGDPFNFSWGTMLQYCWDSGASGLWWWLLPPGIAIVLVVVAFTFMGTAFDEILDPKLRKREASENTRPSAPDYSQRAADATLRPGTSTNMVSAGGSDQPQSPGGLS
jgi:peptide/nickel transport system permease protein